MAEPTTTTTLDTFRAAVEAERAISRQPIAGLDAILAAQARRETLRLQHQQAQDAVSEAWRELRALPELPDTSEMRWAKAILTMPNLAFLEVDTTGLYSDAEVIRVTLIRPLMTGENVVLLDELVRPASLPLTDTIKDITGLDDADVATAPTPVDVWPKLIEELMGRYVVSFSQRFDRDQLAQQAARSNLTPLTFIGEDLQEHARQFFNTRSGSLADFCARVGHPLPAKPRQTAIDRAQGQFALVQAMAQGIFTTVATAPASDGEQFPF